MAGASAGSFFCSDFSRTGNKPSDEVEVFKIHLFYPFFAKIAVHPSLLASLGATDDRPSLIFLKGFTKQVAKDVLPKL